MDGGVVVYVPLGGEVSYYFCGDSDDFSIGERAPDVQKTLERLPNHFRLVQGPVLARMHRTLSWTISAEDTRAKAKSACN